MPASTMVIIETVKTPVCVPNQAAPAVAPEPGQVHFSVAHSGSKNCTARILP